MNSLPSSVTSFLAALAPALGNHLWQSTVFAAVAGVLTLVLKRNQARVHYWLWLAASLKFLFPFALLTELGSRMALPKHAASAQPGVTFVEEFSQAFAPAAAIASPVPMHSGLSPSQLVLFLVIAAWFAGAAVLLMLWFWRWRRVISATHNAKRVTSGREWEAMQRLVPGSPIPLLSSSSTLEPGIVGIFRPALVLPAGIADRLSDAQLEAIIIHELTHVRRRDNFTAALHMLVQGIFWFHPLLWWIGAQLIDERERACDEEVLTRGSDRQVYAEGILKVCEFYLEAPLACVAGVTGSNLKKRIEAIMIHRIAHKLELGKKLLLAALAAAALIVPVLFGLFHPAQGVAQSAQTTGSIPAGFESVFIQPNTTGKPMPPLKIVAGPDGDFVGFRFTGSSFLATHATLPMMLHIAYDVPNFQIMGGPDWVSREKYDVNAKFLNAMDDGKFMSLPLDERSKLMDQRRLMLQSLLADRFKLTLHHESRGVPVYSLVLAPGGAKMHEATPGDTYPAGIKVGGKPIGAGLARLKRGELTGQGISMGYLAQDLSANLGRQVFDNTGLRGHYDFTLQWTPGENKDDSAPFIAAMQEQLGLQLIAQTGPVDVIVIDRAEPAETVAASAAQSKPLLRQAQAQAAPPQDGVSITPKGVYDPNTPVRSRVFFKDGVAEFENVPLVGMLKVAYTLDDSQISGGPNWVASDLFDMTVKSATPLKGDALKSEVQKALTNGFKLAVHRELRPLPVYELLLGSNGSKLTPIRAEEPRGTEVLVEDGRIVGKGIRLKELVDYLQLRTGLPVVDRTRLNGVYDFSLNIPGEHRLRKLGAHNDNTALFRALSDQLGLEMQPRTDPVEVLVIDHAEPPTAGTNEMARAK